MADGKVIPFDDAKTLENHDGRIERLSWDIGYIKSALKIVSDQQMKDSKTLESTREMARAAMQAASEAKTSVEFAAKGIDGHLIKLARQAHVQNEVLNKLVVLQGSPWFRFLFAAAVSAGAVLAGFLSARCH